MISGAKKVTLKMVAKKTASKKTAFKKIVAKKTFSPARPNKSVFELKLQQVRRRNKELSTDISELFARLS